MIRHIVLIKFQPDVAEELIMFEPVGGSGDGCKKYREAEKSSREKNWKKVDKAKQL